MAENHQNQGAVWVIRAGREGQADSLFLQQGYVALGWAKMGDMSRIPNEQNAFKAIVRQTHMTMKPGAIPNSAGQLRRFVYEVKPGDLAVYPSRLDRQIHLGRIVGPYTYNPGLNAEYPHVRKVEWLRAVPRTHFAQGALYEIGGLMTLFQVTTYADDFRAAAEGKVARTPAEPEDETVPQVAASIEENTYDFVLKRLGKELKGHPLADFVAHLLTTMGYRTRVSTPGPDMGVDIVANRGELGFEPPIIKVQVKSGEGSVGGPTVNELLGNVGQGEYGLLVTLGTFSSQARVIARTKSNLRLVDGQELVDLILAHYEQLDSRYKGLLPLKRVYVPDLQEPEGEA